MAAFKQHQIAVCPFQTLGVEKKRTSMLVGKVKVLLRRFTGACVGLRGLRWSEAGWGLGAEFTHAKVDADNETLSKSGFQRLEFTDGLNILTANAFRQWGHADSRLTPYLGAGFGISIPHVEVDGNGVSERGYQLAGPAVRLVGAVSYALIDGLSLFSEYNGTYSQNSADLGAGATLKTNVITNAINVGISYRF